MSIKRTNKELEYFLNKKYVSDNLLKTEYKFYDNIEIQQFIVSGGYNNEDNLHIEITKNNRSLIKYCVPNDYPFKPFTIIKHNFSELGWFKYLNILHTNAKNIDNKILYFFYTIQFGRQAIFLTHFTKNKNYKCYCCSSYSCPMNWNPRLGIKNLLQEYLEIEFINKFVKKKNYKMLISIYNHFLEFYKLPEEIFDLIVYKIL
tara:strand:+ start:1215 stop:1823 length:609 start_codon:yes stop_codon:yes gene_type:complete